VGGCGAANEPVRLPVSSRKQAAFGSEVSGLLIEQLVDAADNASVYDKLIMAASHSRRTMTSAADPRGRVSRERLQQ
jgi:hypothetical protein